MSVRRVLVIDDEDDIREVARVCLEMLGGWEVFTAESGSDGLAKAVAEQPDVILLDVMMPGMDGPTTFHKLREEPITQHIPVIFLTAKVQMSDRRRFAELVAAGFIAKPFDPVTLPQEVAAAAGWLAVGAAR